MPDPPDVRRPLADQVCDVLRQQGTRDRRRHINHGLRWNVNNVLVRCGFETVFVTDAVFHGSPCLRV